MDSEDTSYRQTTVFSALLRRFFKRTVLRHTRRLFVLTGMRRLWGKAVLCGCLSQQRMLRVARMVPRKLHKSRVACGTEQFVSTCRRILMCECVYLCVGVCLYHLATSTQLRSRLGAAPGSRAATTDQSVWSTHAKLDAFVRHAA